MNSIFSENNYVNVYEYYKAKTGNIPSRYLFKNIDFKLLLERLNSQQTFSFTTVCSSFSFDEKKKKYNPGVSIFEINDDIILAIVDPPYNDLIIELLFLEEKSDKELLELIKSLVTNCQIKKDDFRKQLHVMSGNGHFYFEKFDIKAPQIDLSLNYNDDFAQVDELIKTELSKKNNKGIIILHGDPGTGKTFYIRHLIAQLNKQKLYIPPNLAEQIASPSFISVLEDNSDSVLIIEDAESILEKRNAQSGSAVSNLLNLSDGLLADCFNIQIICTFNSSLSNIDEALLRKGRLIAEYEFLPLAVHKAQQLSDSLGNDIIINKPMTLTEVYNINSKTGVKTALKKKVGF